MADKGQAGAMYYLCLMDYHAFYESLSGDEPPISISAYLQALWYDARGNWQRAHEIVQDIDDKKAARIHAYLHRKEGDISNADYWYRRAGCSRPHDAPEQEWESIAKDLL